MEFLVEMRVEVPDSWSREEAERRLLEERKRGRELVAAGAIRSIWRIPGSTANVGIWQAEDATNLHELLSSLPLFRAARIEVVPLARHPLDVDGGDA